jgi:hypothetical protein
LRSVEAIDFRSAVALFAVGGPVLPGAIVTRVELLVEVARPDALSLAVIIAVAPLIALAAAVTTPVIPTAAAMVLDDVKTSPDAESVLVDPSL